ncbi:hypothetical protein YC2023_092651 [Brassica napus]
MKESRPYTSKTSKGRESNERRNLLTRMFLLIGGSAQLGYEDYNSIRAKIRRAFTGMYGGAFQSRHDTVLKTVLNYSLLWKYPRLNLARER